MLRLITSLNWSFGLVALVLALAYPFVYDALFVAGTKSGLEGLVRTVVNAEQENFTLREQYVYFDADGQSISQAKSKLKLDITSNDFLVEAFGDGENLLVVRAMTAPRAMQERRTPPLQYVYTVRRKGEPGEGRWVPLSDRRLGLF